MRKRVIKTMLFQIDLIQIILLEIVLTKKLKDYYYLLSVNKDHQDLVYILSDTCKILTIILLTIHNLGA